MIHKTKRKCWQIFLESDEEEIIDLGKTQSKDKNRCLITLKYILSKTNSTTLMLIGSNYKKAITMQAKEALIRAHIFLPPSMVDEVKY